LVAEPSFLPQVSFDELYGLIIPFDGIISSRYLHSEKQNVNDTDLTRENKMENMSKYGDRVHFNSTCDFLLFAGSNGVDNTSIKLKG
jgi:hypothetical protein